MDFGIPAQRALSIEVPIFKGKGDIRNCSCHRAVKFLEHGLKVLENRLSRIVSVDQRQLEFMRERGTTDAVFIWRRMQEEYHVKGKKLYMCFVDQEKAFYRVLWKVLEWAMNKKEIAEVLIRSVMSAWGNKDKGMSGFWVVRGVWG